MIRLRYALLLLMLLLPVQGWAAVAFDAVFEDGTSGATTIIYTSSTANVAGSVAANPNRVLNCALILRTSTSGTPAVTANTVAMTAINNAVASPFGAVYLFGLKDANITTGAQAMVATWADSSSGTLVCWSLYNVDQTTTWQNFTTSTATSTALTTTAITSTSGNMIVAGAFDNDASSGTFDSAGAADVHDQRFSGNYSADHVASVGASATLSGTLGSSVQWIAAGVDVIAAGGASPDIIPFYKRRVQ